MHDTDCQNLKPRFLPIQNSSLIILLSLATTYMSGYNGQTNCGSPLYTPRIEDTNLLPPRPNPNDKVYLSLQAYP